MHVGDIHVGRNHEIAIILCPPTVNRCDLIICVICIYGYAHMCVRANNVCTYKEFHIHFVEC